MHLSICFIWSSMECSVPFQALSDVHQGMCTVRMLKVGSYREATFFFPPQKALCLPFLLTALLPGTAQHSSNLSCLHHLFEVYFWDAWVLDMKDERLAADFASRWHSVFQISRLASFVTKLYRKMHFCVTANVQTLSPNSLLCATAWAFLFFFSLTFQLCSLPPLCCCLCLLLAPQKHAAHSRAPCPA